jgi:alpha-glucosidase
MATWWQGGIIYQIYPRSFMDANGDGTGDLAGILARLPYLKWLGVDAVWISPIFPSPMADFGYDVADYTDVDPLFGTLEDFDRLLRALHRSGIRVVLDYVPNHTSDRHPWFLESRRSRDNARRGWYIWRDPAPDGGVPNNWRSEFGGSAWAWDATTGQYYLHTYLEEQPDLNWHHPDVQQAMLEVLRFWFDRGVDGFRIDALRQVGKDPLLRDNPPNPDWRPAQGERHRLLPIHSADRPETLDIVRRIREVADSYADRVLIGELWVTIERLMAYYGRQGLHLPFNFHLITTPWNAPAVSALIDRYEAALPEGAWPNWVLGNHDRSRIASRVGRAQARVAAMLLLTLRGTPTLYNGDEIGMCDVEIPAEAVRDPAGRYAPGHEGRDPERTPLQWDPSPHAGFSSRTPWLPLAPDYQTVNVALQRRDPQSMLSLHRALIAIRRATPALVIGAYRLLYADDGLLIYDREEREARLRVALNLSGAPREWPWRGAPGEIRLSTYLDRSKEHVRGPLSLRADEGVIIDVNR